MSSQFKKAIENKLPPAGKRAKLIKSDYQGFRDYLNKHASHSSYSEFSLQHLFDDGQLRLSQPFILKTLKGNVRDLYVQVWLLACEAVNAIQTHELGMAEAQSLALKIHQKEALRVFKLDEVRRNT